MTFLQADGPTGAVRQLQDFLSGSERVVVLTGAGCSTESGIPDYRSPNGSWTKHKPVMFQDFVRSEASRRHYWARSYRGWDRFKEATPNSAHRSIASWEQTPRLQHLITQNVDRLHSRAGSTRVVELHGSNHEVCCLDCGGRISRQVMQAMLLDANLGWFAEATMIAPDGDAVLTREQTADFMVPPCTACGGMLKPAVVFFGESVARPTVDFCMEQVTSADALLVVGSSLTVWSGFRFARTAVDSGKRLAILNVGPTRADDIAHLKVEAPCGETLSQISF